MSACLDENAMGAYFDGALTADEVTLIDAHLNECTSCRKELSAMAVDSGAPPASGDEVELLPGETIGRYLVCGEHARGGMGIVAIAFDPELGRNVAIKVLRSDVSAQRLHDEARAMAKLSHPNVVSVYDVGDHGGRVYLAMELVEGVNLRRWLAEETRTWRAIVRTCLQAGRGLAAAHRAGLVHRDFKPDNVLCGPEDRVRVTDFGLAESDPHAAIGVTGTPAYIAPEVWRGEPATVLSDQWSFCVTLRDAVGTRRVPSAVRHVIARGLQPEPARRYPSLEELLAVLEGALRPRRAWIAAGAVVVIASAAMTIHAYRQPATDPCRMPASLIDDAWSGPAIETAFVGSGRKHGADSAHHVRRTLDGYSKRWLAARTETCMATRVRGDQSETLLDARTRCLDRRRDELAALARLLANKPTPGIVDRAVEAVHALYPVEVCEASGVEAELPLPVDPMRASQILGLDREIAALRAAIVLATEVEDVARKARSVVERARALSYPPVFARASQLLAQLAPYSTDHAETERTLYDALLASATAHDDRGAASVWTDLVAFSAGTKGDAAVALQQIKPAEAALVRAGSPADLRRALRHAQGIALAMHGDFDDARRAFEQAGADAPEALERATVDASLCNVELRLARMSEARTYCVRAALAIERELGPRHPHLGFTLVSVGNLALELRDDAAAKVAFERAMAILADTVGERHVGYALVLNNLGMLSARAGDVADARRYYERSVAILDGLNHPERYLPHSNLGNLEKNAGNIAAARQQWKLALDIATAAQGAESDRAARALYSLGAIDFDAGDLTAARTAYDRALAISVKLYGDAHPETALVLEGLGLLLEQRGDCKGAIPYEERAVAAYEKVYGPEYADLAFSLTALGSCQFKLGDKRALANLDRALAISDRASASDPFDAAQIRWTLAQAVRALGGDRARARVLAQEARGLYAKSTDPSAKDNVAEIERWLARGG